MTRILALCILLPCASFAAEPVVETNVVFGTYSGLALLMDVYKPSVPNGYGIVVINGSGWHRDLGYDAALLKNMNALLPAIRKLVDSGYTAFLITHRAAPRFHYPDAISDVQRAVRFVRLNASKYGIQPDRLGALGGSSGGHLVSLLGTQDGKGDPEASDPADRLSAKVQCVVALFPPTEMTSVGTPLSLGIVVAFMGMKPPDPKAPASSPDVKFYKEASPLNHVTPDDPPFLLIHGDADKTVPYQQSQLMEAALKKAGVPVKLVILPGLDHGTNSTGWEKIDWQGMALDWFEMHLRQSGHTSAAH